MILAKKWNFQSTQPHQIEQLITLFPQSQTSLILKKSLQLYGESSMIKHFFFEQRAEKRSLILNFTLEENQTTLSAQLDTVDVMNEANKNIFTRLEKLIQTISAR